MCSESSFPRRWVSYQEPHSGWVSCLVSDAPEQLLSLMGTRRPAEQTQGQQWVSLGSAWAWQDSAQTPSLQSSLSWAVSCVTEVGGVWAQVLSEFMEALRREVRS